MAMSLNRVQLIGNLTRDPEMKQIPGGQVVTSFGVATNLTWKERIEIDCYYVNNWSMILDVVIFFKTIIIMFFKKNIYEIDVSMEEHGIYNNKKNEE